MEADHVHFLSDNYLRENVNWLSSILGGSRHKRMDNSGSNLIIFKGMRNDFIIIFKSCPISLFNQAKMSVNVNVSLTEFLHFLPPQKL